MADFKLGLTGAEVVLPVTMSALEMPAEGGETVVLAPMLDGSLRANAKTVVTKSHPLEWDNLTSTECDSLDAIKASQTPGVTLNYINGYIGLAAGVAVVISSCPGRILKVPTSGRTTPRYRYAMTLQELG